MVEDNGKDNMVEVLEQRVRSQAIGHVLSVEGGAMAMTAYVHLRRLGVRKASQVCIRVYKQSSFQATTETNC